MEVLVSVPHDVLKVSVILEVGEVGLGAEEVAGGDVADMPAIGIGDELEVLNAVHVFVLGIELGNDPRVFGCEGFEAARNDSDHKIIGRSHSFSQQYGKLLMVVVEQQLHVMEHVLLAVEHIDGVGIIDQREDDQRFAVDDALVFLHLALLVALHLLVQEVLQLLEEVRTTLLDLPQEPVAVLLRAHQGAEFLHFLVMAVDDYDVYVVLVELVDGSDAGRED